MKKFSKRLLTMLLAAAMVFGLSGMTAFAAEADEQGAQNEITTLASDADYQEYEPEFQWYIDLGANADSYEINTPEELVAFSDIVNGTDLPPGVNQNSFAGQTVTLGQDIVMNDADDVWSEPGEWGGIATPILHISEDAYVFTPIGNMRFNIDGSPDSGYSFQGTFDGKTHRIENLFVKGDEGYDGLFGVVGGDKDREEDLGLLENFTVSGVIECDGGSDGGEMDFMGGACAKLNAGATIKNVTNEATIYGPYTDNVGGIVGFAGTPSQMGGSDNPTTNPSYEEDPSGYNTFVLCCANEAIVLGFHKNGGIVGSNAATVKYCYNSGWILCRRNFQQVRMGGIVGTNGNNGAPVEESVIAYCYNTGPISNNGRDDLYVAAESGVRAYAGITGSNYGGSGKNEVYNCYNMGAIPKGYANYNSIASRLDNDPNGYGCGAYVGVRNNYSLDTDAIARNTASDWPQETGYWVSENDFRKTSYGDEDILTGLGPYFIADDEDNPYNDGFPILWWQDEDASLPTLTGITITQEPDKTDYIDGDIFDPTGMVVYAEYTDGVRALLTADVGTYEGITYEGLTGSYTFERTPLTKEPQYVEITYTDRDTTVSAWQPVNNAVPSVGTVTVTSDMTGSTKTYDGEAVTLTAEAQGVDPAGAELTYQWYKGNDAIEGATDSAYTLEGNVSDTGTYKCEVTASYGGAQSEPAAGEIAITIEKAAQEISYETTAVDKYTYSADFTNELTEGTVYGAITYASDNEDVATVDPASGEVTIQGTGTATITATAAGGDNYTEDTASYTLTVSEADIDSEIDVDGETAEWDAGSEEWLCDVTYSGDPIELSMVLDMSEEEQAEVKATSYQWYAVAEDGTATPISGATESTYTLEGDAVNAGDSTYQCEAVVVFDNGHEQTVTSSPVKVRIAKAAQVISFAEPSIATMLGADPFTNELIETTVDTAGGAVITYSSADPDIATVDANGEVTIVGIGVTTITATVSGTANYEGATAEYDLTVDRPQPPTISDVTITSDIAGNSKTYDGEGFTLTVEATVEPDSAVPTYQWYKENAAGAFEPIDGATDSVLDLDGNVSDTGTYKCEVTAATLIESVTAESDPLTVTITQAEQVIEFTEESVTEPVGESYENELTSSSVVFGEITYESDDESVATVDADGTVNIVGVGSAAITATAAGSDNYTEASGSYTITGTDPGLSVEIRSDVPGNEKVYDAEPVILTAEASSSVAGATFTCQWYKDGGEMSGETDVTLSLAGDVSDSGSYTCTVTVTYPNDVTDTVTSEALTITITQAAQEISFTETAVTKTVGDEPFTNELIETTVDTAGGAKISYESSDETIATVDEDGEVTILAEGSVTITATVSATANYEEADAVYDLTIEAAQVPTVGDVTITSNSGSTKTYDGAGVSLTAAAQVTPAGAEVTYQWYKDGEPLEGATGNVLNLDGNVSDTGTYTCDVTATDVGGSASGEGALTLTITPAAQEISFAESAVTKKVGDEPFANELIETTVDTAGGAAITYESSNETIATVDESGQVTILAEGSVTITATVSATANYTEADAAYALTVKSAQEPTVDKTVLEAAISDAEGLDASKYTEDSWNALLSALEAAQKVDADDNATRDDVKEAEINLIGAIAGLVDAGGSGTETDKTDLMEEYVNALELSESDYTAETWKPFAEAREAAMEVLLDVDATQADVDNALDALKTAQDNLKKSGSGGEPKNGLCQITPGELWGYYVDDKVDTTYTGFASNANGDWWVVNGYVRFDVNSVEKDPTGKTGDKGVTDKGIWWYVIGNKVQHNFTGLANYKNANGWWYIKSGQVDFSRNSVDKNNNGWYYVLGGKVRFDFTGLADYKNANGWWYISGGKVNFNHNGVDKNKNGWYYVVGGKVRFDYTGVANYKNANGWWYIAGGKVDFGFTGRASNKNGTWNVVNGKVVF